MSVDHLSLLLRFLLNEHGLNRTPLTIHQKDMGIFNYNPRNSQFEKGINKRQGIIEPLKDNSEVIKNGILLERTNESLLKQAQYVKLIKAANSLHFEADGFVGFEMILSHDDGFSIIPTKAGYISKAFTTGNETKVIILNHETNELFTTKGNFEIVEVIAATLDGVQLFFDLVTLPSDFSVSHAFPNPFNPVTSFQVSIPQNGFTTVSVYNLRGQNMETIHEGELTAGVHHFGWNGKTTASGIYLLRSQWKDKVSIQKLILMK